MKRLLRGSACTPASDDPKESATSIRGVSASGRRAAIAAHPVHHPDERQRHQPHDIFREGEGEVPDGAQERDADQDPAPTPGVAV
jgi:hypothetical protein